MPKDISEVPTKKQKQICAAADQLVSEGIENPTNAQVRKVIGTGSFTDIAPVMNRWRESIKENIVAVLEMPTALKKSIEISFGRVWAVASELASEKTESVRLEFKAKLQKVNLEYNEALDEIEQLENKLTKLSKALKKKTQEEIQREKAIELKNKEVITLLTEITALEAEASIRNEQIRDLKNNLKIANDSNHSIHAEYAKITQRNEDKKIIS